MNNMPMKLRVQLMRDDEYKTCARKEEGGCAGRITWEHAIMYAGRQVQERFAIIPLCHEHHLGTRLNKAWNIKYALSRATDADKKKYPRLPWAAG